ncbi:MAG: PEP-CTERM system histidine kinase PrsK, partial [Rubrivivax sp.]
MNSISVSLAGASYAVAALAYGAYALFAIYLLVWGTPLQRAARSLRWSTAAVLASIAWAAAAWLAIDWNASWLPHAAAAFDLLRYGLWFGFLLALFGADPASAAGDAATTRQRVPAFMRLRVAAVVAVAASALTLVLRPTAANVDVDGDAVARLWVITALVLPVLGLLTIEQLFRNLRDDVRWHLKPVFLGLACVFVFDVYLYAEGLLFANLDPDALAVRGLAHALAAPFLFIAARRGSGWLARLQVSRAAAFHSATLVLAGAYLLFMSAIGYYVRYFGGEWGRGLQIGLLIVAVALMCTLAFSSALRSWLRVFVGKHFFRLR